MNELQVFRNQEFGSVRTLTVNDEPWFVGKDVAIALGFKTPEMQLEQSTFSKKTRESIQSSPLEANNK